jgi:hypothetical protein
MYISVSISQLNQTKWRIQGIMKPSQLTQLLAKAIPAHAPVLIKGAPGMGKISQAGLGQRMALGMKTIIIIAWVAFLILIGIGGARSK